MAKIYFFGNDPKFPVVDMINCKLIASEIKKYKIMNKKFQIMIQRQVIFLIIVKMSFETKTMSTYYVKNIIVKMVVIFKKSRFECKKYDIKNRKSMKMNWRQVIFLNPFKQSFYMV